MPDNTSVCPLCAKEALFAVGKPFSDYITKDKFVLLRCNACESYITQISAAALAKNYYGTAYYNSAQGKFSPLVEKIFRFNHRRQALLFYRRFRPQAVLEIGCGRAYQLIAFRQFGAQAYGLESAAAPEWILKNPEVEIKGLSPTGGDQWPIATNSMDLVIFCHVLEHLADPVQALQEAARVLQGDKIVSIDLPNVSSFQARLRLSSWFHLDVPRHLFHFNKKGIIALLLRQGYEIIEVSSGDALQNIYGWWQSLANLFTPHDINSLYRFLQGGDPRKTVSLAPLLIQIITSVLWVPLGLAGYLAEIVSGNTGVISIRAKKKSA